MNIRACFQIIALLLSTAASLLCTQPVDIAGGGSGTEISGRAIQGTVRDTAQQPASGGVVRLRPFDYLASVPVDDSTQKQDITITSNGTFSIENIPVGHYIIECTYNDSFSHVIDCVIDSLDSLSVYPDITVQPMAIVSGKDILSEPSQQHPIVEVRGLERSVEVDSDGAFQMMVPYGWRSLHFRTPGSSEEPRDTLVHFNIGERKEFIGQLQDSLTLCDNVECELLVVKALLDSNGITTVQPESLVVIEDNHITELHMKELGLTSLPADVGDLFHLEILDISANQIEELPSAIENLHNLKSIKADHNNIRLIPASIGTLNSLEFVDFAFNNLQTLPEPITYLELKYALFGFNMLCNIGERTMQWLNSVDKRWAEIQDCH